MELLDACPACKAQNHHFIRKCKDFTVSSEYFNIVQCTSCKLLFTNPRPNASEIGHYYESPDYISHSNSNKGLINKLYKMVRTYSLQSKLKLVNSLQIGTEKSIIDIGCGTGEFLATCKKDGWKTLGVEPNQSAREQAKSNYDLNIQPEEYLLNPEQGTQIITMWHVLEHVHNLNGRLQQIHGILKKDGYLIIAVPNPGSWDAKHYNNEWAAYDVPRHLYHFTPDVLKNLVSNYGFVHIKSKPMPFDSFYVSMLSEKYLNGTGNILNAAWRGLSSNLRAGNEAEQYSSVIYIFRKT